MQGCMPLTTPNQQFHRLIIIWSVLVMHTLAGSLPGEYHCSCGHNAVAGFGCLLFEVTLECDAQFVKRHCGQHGLGKLRAAETCLHRTRTIAAQSKTNGLSKLELAPKDSKHQPLFISTNGGEKRSSIDQCRLRQRSTYNWLEDPSCQAAFPPAEQHATVGPIQGCQQHNQVAGILPGQLGNTGALCSYL